MQHPMPTNTPVRDRLRRSFAPLLFSVLAFGAGAAPQMDFTPASDISGGFYAANSSGLIFVSQTNKTISGGGSTSGGFGAGFCAVTVSFQAEISNEEAKGRPAELTYLTLRFNSDTFGPYSGGTVHGSLFLNISEPVAFRVDNTSDTNGVSSPSFASSPCIGTLDPGTLRVDFSYFAESHRASTWRMAFGPDPRRTLYSTGFATFPTDEGWTVHTTNVASFEIDPEGLQFNFITPVTGGRNAPWSVISFERAIPSTNDLQLDASLRWCSDKQCLYAPTQAVQRVSVELLDSEGEVLTRAGFDDSWIDAHGQILAASGNVLNESGKGSLDAFGTCAINLTQTDSSCSAFCSSENTAISAKNPQTNPARFIRLNFSRWPGRDSIYGLATMGLLAIDSLSLASRYACISDFNIDGFVDDTDFLVFIQAYNVLDCTDPTAPVPCASDLNADSLVNDADFVIFVLAYKELLCHESSS